MKNPPLLPYDPEVGTWSNRMIDFDDQVLTYEEAYKHAKYVDLALGIDETNAETDRLMPIEFTQFVLRKMAVNEKGSHFDARVVHKKAMTYFYKNLIGNRISQIRRVHPRNNSNEGGSTYRGILTKVFCKKVIMNLKKIEDRYYDKFARVFPFVICKDVPDYNTRVLNCYDDDFYITVQQFLNEHFDNVEARRITKLFLNNIYKFLKEKPPDYIHTFPTRLNRKGIRRQQILHAEYRNVREHFKSFSLPDLNYNIDYFENLLKNNIDDLSYLLQSNFRTKTKTYYDTFTKYLFFFVHALNENTNQVLFIDDVIYQCLRSLKRYKTVEEDLNLINDIASIALLDLVKCKLRSGSVDKYRISSLALENVKKYITEMVDGKNVQLNAIFNQFGVISETAILVQDTLFNTQYAENDRIKNNRRGIRNFPDSLATVALSPDENPIKYLITYNAFSGEEKKFTVPEELRESLKNFIQLSIKNDQPSGASYNALTELFKNFVI